MSQEKYKMMEDEIVNKITVRFRCFGGGKGSSYNPLAEALKDTVPSFAARVDVRQVVCVVIYNVLNSIQKENAIKN